MTESSDLLVEINKTLRAAMPGVTQAVRRRIAADVHQRLKPLILDRDKQIRDLERDIKVRDQLLLSAKEEHRKSVQRVIRRAATTMEQIYAEEAQQSH